MEATDVCEVLSTRLRFHVTPYGIAVTEVTRPLSSVSFFLLPLLRLETVTSHLATAIRATDGHGRFRPAVSVSQRVPGGDSLPHTRAIWHPRLLPAWKHQHTEKAE